MPKLASAIASSAALICANVFGAIRSASPSGSGVAVAPYGESLNYAFRAMVVGRISGAEACFGKCVIRRFDLCKCLRRNTLGFAKRLRRRSSALRVGLLAEFSTHSKITGPILRKQSRLNIAME